MKVNEFVGDGLHCPETNSKIIVANYEKKTEQQLPVFLSTDSTLHASDLRVSWNQKVSTKSCLELGKSKPQRREFYSE